MPRIVRSLRSANLNLVPILRALLTELSVTRAARTLSLSPSATSGALAQLRLLLHDPLLIRSGSSMRLTAKAEQMVGKLQEACVALESLLLQKRFDPQTAQRTFIVSALDYISLLLGKRLMDGLFESAPGIRVRFVDVTDDLEDLLSAGEIDLGVVAMNPLSWARVSATRTCSDRLVGVVDRRHPLARRRRLSERELARHPHLRWDPGLELSARAARINGRPLAWPDTPIQIQSFVTLAPLVVNTAFFAIIPRSLALRMVELLPLAFFELPAGKLVINTAVIWSPNLEGDPAHRWFRELVFAALQSTHDPGGLVTR